MKPGVLNHAGNRYFYRRSYYVYTLSKAEILKGVGNILLLRT